MNRKYSKYSIILIFVGIFIASMAFPPINIDLLGWWGIFVGFGIYSTGIVISIIAFLKKEEGLLKYISLLSISLGAIFLAFLYAIVGRI
ncbi:hypothetical protein NCCP2716_30120 [Sporosarcina sp. NCCP-2716]|uniref:hypothetical protein n=1 Tax=Sporosarcina sp. NCCP-2716 TaxID=2943679 RepID=UPI0020404340|nr:hypothetical protein [Sporosarcina sp. NCCP-2716]GKV70514.1 hypothetical protein NCCP2716_30120 [Sporosarcina sp. NCCP-2716]